MKKRLLGVMLLAPWGAFALPQGGIVTEGSAALDASVGAQLTVQQGSDRALIDWQSFDIGAGETVRFVQPGAGSIAINRVSGEGLAPSQIDGNLFANGNVWVLNPNGVLLGSGARLDVGGLAIGAAHLADDGSWVTTGGQVVNRGQVTVGAGGIVLAGQEVANHGTLATHNGGVVTLAAGQRMQVGLLGGLVTMDADAADVGLKIENTGDILTPGGRVSTLMQAVDAGVMNIGGRIVANTVGEQGGVIRLGYAPDVQVTGEVSAEGDDAGERGGRVDVLGTRVVVAKDARVSANGAAGGGAVLVGGDMYGAGSLPTAEAVAVAKGAQLTAHAMHDGDGGKVVVWADGVTNFGGHVGADGAGRGDGGSMEVSGKEALVFRGTASAQGVQKGNLLLDPQDIVIANGNGAADDVEVGDGVILAAENAGGTYTISEQALEGLSAGTNVNLEATRNLMIADLADDLLTLASTGSVRLIADSDLDGVGNFSMNAGDHLETPAAVTIRGANLALGTLDTTAGNSNLVLETTNSAGDILLGGTLHTGTGGLTLAGDLQKVTGIDLTDVGGITLSGNSSLTGGDVVMGAGNTINGAHTLTVTGYEVTLGQVGGGTPLTGLTVNASGDVGFLGNVTTNGVVNVQGDTITGAASAWQVLTGGGALTLGDPLILAGTTILNSGGGLLTLDTADGGYGLVLTSGAGNTVVNGILGAGTPLASLAHSGNALSVNAVRTSGAQVYNAATTAQGTLASSGGAIAFNNTLTLAGNTAVQVAGANNVTLGGTVNGAHDLGVTLGSGKVNFNSAVGGVTPLANLTVAGGADVNAAILAAGNVVMTGGVVNLANDITAGDDLTLGGTLNLLAGSVLTGGGSNGDVITLHNPPTGAFGLTLVAGSGQVVLGGLDIGTLNLTSADGVTLNAGNYLTDTAQDWSNMGAVTLGGDAALVAGNGPGYAALTFGANNDVTGAGHDLSLRGSTVTLDGIAGVEDLTVNGGSVLVNQNIGTTGTQTYTGTVTLGANLTSANSNILLNNAVVLTGDRVIDTGAGLGDIDIGGTVNGAHALTLLGGTGVVTVYANVGNVTPLTDLTITAAGAGLLGVATTGDMTVTADTVVAGLLDAGGDLLLDGDILANPGAAFAGGGDVTVTGNILLNTALVVTSGGGAGDLLTLGGGADGDYLLTLAAGLGDIMMTGDFDLDALTVTSADDLIYGGGAIRTDQAMVFTTLNRLLLGGDTLIEAQDGSVRADITMGSSNQILATTAGVDLTITGDVITLYQIGDTGAGRLQTLTVNAGTVQLLGDVYTLGNQTINATEGLAGLLVSGGGDITLNTSANLLGDVQVQSNGGDVYFLNVLNGAYDLLVQAGTGDIYVMAALGGTTALGDVAMYGANIYLNAPVRTAGSQLYVADRVALASTLATLGGDFTFRAPVEIAGTSRLETTSGNITFEETLDGGHDLTLAAGSGNIDAQGAVGAAVALGQVNVEGAANVVWTGGLYAGGYDQTGVTGLTDVRGPGIRVEGVANIVDSARVLGHVQGDVVAVEARESWVGTVVAREQFILSSGFSMLEGKVGGEGGRTAAIRTLFGNFHGGSHYLNGYALPLADLSVALPAQPGAQLPWQAAWGSYVAGAEDGLWGSLLDWPDLPQGALWGYTDGGMPELHLTGPVVGLNSGMNTVGLPRQAVLF